MEKEKKLNILAIQMSSKIGDIEFNRAKTVELIEKNINDKVDLVILPEVWTVGWSCKDFHASAESLEESITIKILSECAKKYSVNIIGGSFIVKKEDGSYANTCPVVDRKGQLTGIYNKMHLFSYYGCNEGSYAENGLTPVMVSIDGVKTGLSICYDLRFPELYRSYAKAGADLLINMAAWPMTRRMHWYSLTNARAIENQCYFVALTQSGVIKKDEWNLGVSRVINYNGEIISEISEGEGAVFAELNINEMYEFRKKCTVLKDVCNSYEVKSL